MASTLMLLANPYRPDPRVRIEARTLVAAGYRVQVLAWGRDTGKTEMTDEEGIEIIRVGPVCPFRSAWRMVSSLPRYWMAALRASRSLQFDLIHSHDLDTLPLGLCISRLTGKPLIYDGHELYSAMVKDEVGPMYRPLSMLEHLLVKQADSVVTVSETLAGILSRGRGDNARIVRTSPEATPVSAEEIVSIRAKYGIGGFVLGYLGSLEPGRFVEELAEAFAPEDGVTVLIAGSGSLQDRVKDAAKQRSNVVYIGSVSAEEALRLTAASDLVAAMMDHRNPNNVIGTPGKILNSMALAKPVVTNEGLEIARLVESVGCGVVTRYNRDDFRRSVLESMKDPARLKGMGEKGKNHFDKHLSWSKSRDELLAVYRLLLGTDQ
ncbi:MAG: glycosyltransferase family 4 protein [Candidatus Thermoplasmatota archaeon]|nr:glycosyltransferase family 4 protein [Candidatus Thermoplasmatota archaeon]